MNSLGFLLSKASSRQKPASESSRPIGSASRSTSPTLASDECLELQYNEHLVEAPHAPRLRRGFASRRRDRGQKNGARGQVEASAASSPMLFTEFCVSVQNVPVHRALARHAKHPPPAPSSTPRMRVTAPSCPHALADRHRRRHEPVFREAAGGSRDKLHGSCPRHHRPRRSEAPGFEADLTTSCHRSRT